MREIKLRGYDEENKCWRYGWYIRLQEGIRKYHAIICDEDGPLVSYYIHNENTIGQFTGLHDKNGIEIYEGDIVKDAYGQVNDIKYYGCGYWFNWLDLINHSEQIENGEIIGNIHENPELLEEPHEHN